MKRIVFVVTLVILIIFMELPPVFAVEYKTASVVEVTGMVSVLKAGGEKVFTPKVDTVLEHGDRIITGKGASIALQIDADKYIKVGEKTYISLNELMSEAELGGDSTNIKLFTGKVWASLSKPLAGDDSFEIETSTSVISAKGTKFFVKYMISPTKEQQEKSSTELVVLEGKVSMKTQVQMQGEAGAAPASQNVELLANANESLLLDPALVQGISDEISSRLKAGERIDQINIQEVISKVGQAKKIEVKNLDLFVLEIVADEPDAYDPNVTDGLDQLIEQKRQEPQDNADLGEGPPRIIYDLISGAGGAGTVGAAPPAVPQLPHGASGGAGIGSGVGRKDDDDGGDGGGDNDIVALKVTKVDVVDAVSSDGIADHIVVTFNQDVRDSTYVSSNGAYIESGGTLGSIDLSKISTDSISGLTNVSNDSILVFNLDTTGKSINTIPIGFFNIPHTGMIQSQTGVSLGTVNNLLTTDKIAPVVLGAMISFDGTAKDKFVRLVYSEPIYNLSSNLWENVRIAATAETIYSEAQTIGYEMTSSAVIYVEAQKLDYPTVRYVKDAVLDGYEGVCLKMNSEVPSYVSDINGNQRLLQKDINLLGFEKDTQKTMVSDVTVQTLTPNTDYLFTIKLNDYLSAEQMKTLTSTPQSFLNGTFSNANAEFIDVQYLFGNTDYININFHVTVFGGALANGDAVNINYSHLYDMFGYPVTDYFDNAEQTTRIYQYDSSADAWTMDMTPGSGFYATSAATIDVDCDGLVDHLQVTFNKPVDDSTFIAENGIYLQSGCSLDPVDDSVIVTNLTGAYADSADDTVVYLKLDNTSSSISYNTGGVGTLTIPSGTLKNLEGSSNDASINMTTIDHAAPVIVAGIYSFEGTVDDKTIKLIASEPLASYSLETPDFRILNSDSSTHNDAYPIAFGMMNMNVGDNGNELKIERLDYNAIKQITQYVVDEESTYLYYNDGLTIADELGNQMVLTGKKIALQGSILDSGKTTIKTIDLTDLGSNEYRISLIFDDYLDISSAVDYMGMLDKAVSFIGDNNSKTIKSYNYNDSVFDEVSLSFVLQMDAPLLTTDQFLINILNLLDYKGGQTCVTNGGVDRTKFNLIYDSGWTFDSPYLSLLEANTVDYDENGKIDFIQLVFDKSVKDASFVDVGAMVNSSLISPSAVDTSAIVSPDGLDSPNDTTIYFAVAEGDFGNTAAEGTLDIPSAGMIESIYEQTLPVMSGIHVNDKAGPVLIDSTLDLSLPYDEKFISVKFSEPLNESDVVDVSTLKLMSSGIYASGPIDLYGTTSVLGDQIFIRPLELGSGEDEAPSFISRLSKYLYNSHVPTSGIASLRLESGFAISSDHGENYVLLNEHTYPYDASALSSIKRINNTSEVASVAHVTSGSGIRITYTDYIESWNHVSNAYMPALANVSVGNCAVKSQKVGSDHKTLEIELSNLPQIGDRIDISQVRNITNSYGDDANKEPIYAQDVSIIFDGTDWQIATD